MKIKMNAVAAATALVLGGLSTAANADLVITEYIEGSGNNKAIELYNSGDTAQSLNGYKLVRYKDSATTTTDMVAFTDQEIPAKGILVVRHADAVLNLDSSVAEVIGGLQQNGTDAVALLNGAKVIDIVGAVPTPKNWGKDVTLRRKNTTSSMVAKVAFDEKDWASQPKDTVDGFGCIGEDACSGDVTPPTPPKPIPTPDPAPEKGPCTNCETLTPVADPDTFNDAIYYSDVLNSEFDSAEDLKNALSAIIAKNHKQLSYKQVWSTLTYADQDPNNNQNVIEIYTGASISKYDNQTSGSGVGKWNREHVWAKSHGFPSQSQWGFTDAHHLRPSDTGINSKRSNNDFGECKDTGEEVEFNGKGTGNYLDKATDCWEPRDEVKGDVARMIMYMDTRYQGTDNATTKMPDLVIVDRLTTTAEDGEPLIGTLCALYEWNKLDAVDTYEQNRNNQIYKYQGNRNPFIDRPELVQAIYGAQCNDDPSPSLVVDGDIVAPDTAIEGSTYSLDASAITAGEGVTLSYKWERVTDEGKEVVGNEAILSLTAPMVDADKSLNFVLTISDGTLATTQSVSISVTDVPLTLDIEFAGTTKVAEGEQTSITATVADAPAGTLYSWKQVSGTAAEYTANGLVLDVTSPAVSIDQTLVFELTATVGGDSFSQSVSIEVTNNETTEGWTKPDGAGSLGGLMTLLLPLIWFRRRQ
ncbi:endonuclease [Shewanella sp.]|nr:endonuclease [Shewanella sp.]